MGIIKELDISLANLVAAGEVVERPASVVKELCENSIDAGAKNITVEIKNGGITLIRVTDDGCGMSPEDCAMSIKRHATSKLRKKSDLDAIMTLGFRGEALAATAAVARLRIITKKEDDTGVVLTSCPREGVSINETGCAKGTTIMVENLFENVPARRKFLKRDTTEAMYVSSVCEKLALSNPDISFSFISDGVMKFSTAGAKDLKSVIYAVLGRSFASNMIKVDCDDEGISVKGYLGSPDSARGNRNGQIFFINGRCIKSKTLSAALEEGTVSYTPKEKYPCAVLMITMHPAYVDVNVHPAKTEVRFANEKAVFESVYRAVKLAVTENEKKPEIDVNALSGAKYRVSEAFTPRDEKKTDVTKLQLGVNVDAPKEEPKREAVLPKIEPKEEKSAVIEHKKPTVEHKIPVFDSEIPREELSSHVASAPVFKKEEIKEEKEEIYSPPKPEIRYIGEFFKTYLLAECGDKAYIIDKHAAHERLIFERMKRNLKDKDRLTQILMIPLECSLTSEELGALTEYADEIKGAGFDFKNNGREVEICEIPLNLSPDSAKELFLSITAGLSCGERNAESARQTVFEKSLYQSCCKAAIKAGEINGHTELESLVKELLSTPDITHCPHGRPTAFVIEKTVLERRFGRD